MVSGRAVVGVGVRRGRLRVTAEVTSGDHLKSRITGDAERLGQRDRMRSEPKRNQLKMGGSLPTSMQFAGVLEILATHQSSTSSPSTRLGASDELIRTRLDGGQTFSQYSTLTDWGALVGPPALGPEMNAFKGILAGRRAKSYMVYGKIVCDQV